MNNANLIRVIFNMLMNQDNLDTISATLSELSIEENADMHAYAIKQRDVAHKGNGHIGYDIATRAVCHADCIAELAEWHFRKQLDAARNNPF